MITRARIPTSTTISTVSWQHRPRRSGSLHQRLTADHSWGVLGGPLHDPRLSGEDVVGLPSYDQGGASSPVGLGTCGQCSMVGELGLNGKCEAPQLPL